MGRKSRLKRERKLTEPTKNKTSTSPSEDNTLPTVLYRFFDEASHADDFVSGKIRISTVQKCREYDDPKQGDKEEATLQYTIEKISQDPHITSNINQISKRVGIFVSDDCENVTISNASSEMILYDAYVLCTTLEYSPDEFQEGFGKYCVRINNPYVFAKIVGHTMYLQTGIGQLIHSKINYRPRTIQQHEDESLYTIGFVKPIDPYAPQKEYRFLWNVKSLPISPIFLSCPDLSRVCERIL